MTKFNIKTLVAAVVLAATASQANAAMVNAQSGNSSMIMYAWSDSLGRSYSRDLGINLDSFLYNGASAPTAGSYPFNTTLGADMSVGAGNVTNLGYTLTFGADSLMTSWLGNGSVLSGDVKWGIAAVDGTGTGSAYRALTTVTAGAASAGTTNSELGSFEGKFDNFLAAHTSLGTHPSNMNGSSGSDGSNAVTANASASFGMNWGGASSFNAAGTVGESMEFFFLAQNGTFPGGNITSARYSNAEGNATWTLNADSSFAYMAPDAASPVPVPAAVWMFASGLTGLVGIARRKKLA